MLAEACLRFLRGSGVTNLYLYEGIVQPHPGYLTYCILEEDEVEGVLHAKTGYSLHLFLGLGISTNAVDRASDFVRRLFPDLRILFCDERSLFLFEERYGVKPYKVRRFISMSLERGQLHPVRIYSSATPPSEHAPLLVPLQVQYEVEEIGSDPSVINRKLVLKLLERRMQRGEITAIYERGLPVAIAGLNARFENNCQVGSVYVKPEYRGRGFGLSVVSSHVERLLRRYDRVLLFVDEKNSVARHIYEKLGFRSTGVLVQASFSTR